MSLSAFSRRLASPNDDASAADGSLVHLLLNNLSGLAYRSSVEAPWAMQHVGNGAETLSGYAADDFLSGKVTWAAVTHPDDLATVAREIATAVAERRQFTLTYRIVHRSGTEKWVLERGQAVFNGSDEAIALIGFISDITEQKLAEQRLRDAEERYRLAAQATRDAIWDWNLLTDQVLLGRPDSSPYGYAPAASGATGERWKAHIHPEDRDRIVGSIEAAVSIGHDHWTDEYRYLKADGTYAHVLDRGYIIYDASGKATRIVGAATDVTERRRAESSLRETEGRFRRLADHVPVTVWLTDVLGDIVFLSRAWHQQTGLREADGLGAAWWDAVHPDDADRVRRTTTHAHHECAGFEIEFRLRTAGEYRWVLSTAVPRFGEDGVFLGYVGSLLDISDRKEAEMQLARSEESLRLMQGAAHIGGYDADATGSTTCTSEFLKLYGLPPETISIDFETWLARVHPDDQPWAREQAYGALRNGDRIDHEYRIIRADNGETRWVASRGKIRRDPGGRVTRFYGAQWDITARKSAEAALIESEALNRSIVEASADCIELLDLDGNLLFINGPGQRMMEIVDFDAIRGKPWSNVWPEEVRPDLADALTAARAGGVGRFSALCPTARGARKWWDVVVSPVLGENGAPIKLVGISRDMTQQKESEEHIRWTAEHDQLTELPNRRAFHERLRIACADARATNRPLGLLVLDIDRFKEVNDTVGHDAGDFLLRVFSERLAGVVRRTDAVARLGGDEFAVILPDLTRSEDVEPIAQAILARLRQPVTYQGRSLDCRASIGGSVSTGEVVEEADLLKCADTALYYAKSAGRGRFVIFEPSMRSSQQVQSSMIGVARRALDSNRITPFYQPKVDFNTGRIVGFEALLRWSEGGKAVQLPERIAAAFDDPDLAPMIGSRMLEQVAADMCRWRDEGLDFGRVAVNASAIELRSPDYAERVLATLSARNISAHWLEIEVTESVVLGRGIDLVETTLRRLSEAGVTIALDDFGTGYASLAHLRRLPVNTIKIDRSFVGDFVTDPTHGAIARTVIGLGRGLGIQVVAEGIETEAQAAFLCAHGCDIGQGFFFGKPMPAAEVAQAIRSLRLHRLANAYITCCATASRCRVPCHEDVAAGCCAGEVSLATLGPA